MVAEVSQQRSRLNCLHCGEPIRRSKDSYDERWEGSAIERAWHLECRDNSVDPDSPLQSAVQKAKQARLDAERLGMDAYTAFLIEVSKDLETKCVFEAEQ